MRFDRLQAERIIAVLDLGVEVAQKVQAEHAIDAALLGEIVANNGEVFDGLVDGLEFLNSKFLDGFYPALPVTIEAFSLNRFKSYPIAVISLL